jgi:hypothetical protein
VKRGFWVALGLGAGVATAVMVNRWLRRQRERYSPANIGASIAEGTRDFGHLVREAMDEGRRAMEEREAEIRASLPE